MADKISSYFPKFELVDKEGHKPKEKGTRHVKCSSCNQSIEKIDGLFVFHTRRVFRKFIPDTFKPDWQIEPCPGWTKKD